MMHRRDIHAFALMINAFFHKGIAMINGTQLIASLGAEGNASHSASFLVSGYLQFITVQ